MIGKLVLAAMALGAATLSPAHPLSVLDRTVAMQGGATLSVFKDGKMSMEDRLGRVVSMLPGQPMQTRDGQSITMVGNETARLYSLLKTLNGGPSR